MNIRQATTEMGTFYYLAEDFFIAGALDHGFAWELGVLHGALAHLPAEGPCNVIDVGAHVGLHTIPYARRVQGRGLVYAFEPHPLMAELLCRNAEVNKCSASVEVFRFAAGHIDGVEVSLEDVIYLSTTAPMRDSPIITRTVERSTMEVSSSG
jgi:FkbM family methyltransferase